MSHPRAVEFTGAGLAWAVVVLALAPTVVRAQAPARAGSPGPESWVLSLGVQEGWEKNIRNRANTENDSDTVTRLVGTLAHSRVGPRLTLDFTADGAGNFYRVNNTLNRFNYSGAVGMGYRLSPHTTFGLRESLVSTYTTDLVGFDDQGEILELTLVRRNRASASLAHQISTRSTLSFNARHDYVDFDSDLAIDGKRYGAGLDLSRRFGQATTWTLAANVARSERSGTVADVGVTTLGFRHGFGRFWTASLNGGITYIQGVGESQTRWNGESELARRAERSNFSLGYARRVGQAFGLGRERESDVYRLGYDRAIGAKLALAGDFGYTVSRDPFDADFSLKTQSYTAALTYNLSRAWGLRGSYLFRRRTGNVGGANGASGEPVDGQRAMLSLNYRKAWR